MSKESRVKRGLFLTRSFFERRGLTFTLMEKNVPIEAVVSEGGFIVFAFFEVREFSLLQKWGGCDFAYRFDERELSGLRLTDIGSSFLFVIPILFYILKSYQFGSNIDLDDLYIKWGIKILSKKEAA